MTEARNTKTPRPERLDAYRLAVEFYRLVSALVIPRGSGLRDQLSRAASSVPLTIAEGLGRSGAAPDAARRLVRRVVQTTDGLWRRQVERCG